MKCIFISPVLSILLAVVVSGTQEYKTNYIQPVTEPVTEDIQPVTEPVTEDIQPVTEDIQPVTEPVTEDIQPVTEDIQPVTEEKESKINYIQPTKDDRVKVTFGTQEFNNAINTIKLRIPPNITLLHTMIFAEKFNDAFRFNSTKFNFDGCPLDGCKYITSIGGLAEEIFSDKQEGNVWMLYNCNNILDPCNMTTLHGCFLADKGVSSIIPKNGDIWIFRYQLKKWNK